MSTLELFDLDALAEAMAGNARFAALSKAIRQASSMSSVKNDLARAEEMLAACKQMQSGVRRDASRGEPVDRHEAATIQALFAQSVFLYTRATHSKGAARNKLQLAEKLTAPLRVIHDRLTGLRDHYLAHFGEPGAWERHRTVLAFDIEQAQMALSYPHETYYVRAGDAQDLETLLVAAAGIADDAYVKASERLNLILNGLLADDRGFLAALRAHPFSPETFFAPDEVEPYLQAIGSRDPDPFTSPSVIVPGDNDESSAGDDSNPV